MPLLVYLSYDYVLPRFAVWLLLFGVVLIDGWRHRSIRTRGYQLFWSLVGRAVAVGGAGGVLQLAAGQTEGRGRWLGRTTQL